MSIQFLHKLVHRFGSAGENVQRAEHARAAVPVAMLRLTPWEVVQRFKIAFVKLGSATLQDNRGRVANNQITEIPRQQDSSGVETFMSRQGNDLIEVYWRDVHAKVQGKLAITLTLAGTFILVAFWLLYHL